MENSVVDINEQSRKFNVRSAAGAAAAGGLVALSLADSASAQTAPTNSTATADITAMVTGLGLLAGAALAVALVPSGINYALKIVQRVMSRA